MDQISTNYLYRFSQICLNKDLPQNAQKTVSFGIRIQYISVLCFTNIVISVKKCFDNGRFVSVQNAAFDITNAGKNTTLIFVIQTVEYKMRACNSVQTIGTKQIYSFLKRVFGFGSEVG